MPHDSAPWCGYEPCRGITSVGRAHDIACLATRDWTRAARKIACAVREAG